MSPKCTSIATLGIGFSTSDLEVLKYFAHWDQVQQRDRMHKILQASQA